MITYCVIFETENKMGCLDILSNIKIKSYYDIINIEKLVSIAINEKAKVISCKFKERSTTMEELNHEIEIKNLLLEMHELTTSEIYMKGFEDGKKKAYKDIMETLKERFENTSYDSNRKEIKEGK